MKAILAGALVAFCALTASGCTENEDGPHADPYAACVARATRLHPHLEQVAAAVLTGIPYTVQPYDACDDDPDDLSATVIATVPEWSRRRAALRHLAAHGWQDQRAGIRMTSPDGTVEAHPVQAGASGSDQSWVLIYFTQPTSR